MSRDLVSTTVLIDAIWYGMCQSFVLLEAHLNHIPVGNRNLDHASPRGVTPVTIKMAMATIAIPVHAIRRTERLIAMTILTTVDLRYIRMQRRSATILDRGTKIVTDLRIVRIVHAVKAILLVMQSAIRTVTVTSQKPAKEATIASMTRRGLMDQLLS